MKKYDYLIIGGDAAGLSAAVQIRTNHKDASIGILEKSRIISYGACGLPYVLGGMIEDFKSLIHFSPDKFAATYNCDVLTEHEATAVDTFGKKVTAVAGGEEKLFSYSKLLIATGASPVNHPPFNFPADRIFNLKTIPDGDKIRTFLNDENNASFTIIGAGYIGLEVADMLAESGKEVILVDIAERPVERMPERMGKVITKLLEEKNVKLMLGTKITGYTEHPGSIEIQTEGNSFHTNGVLVATGISPNTGFLQTDNAKADLENNRGALVVDRFCRTSSEDVYAAGDCALVHHRLLDKNVYIPLGSTANKQGRIAGLNMAGVKTEFPGIIGTAIFMFAGHAFARTGLDEQEAATAGYDAVTVSASRPSKAGYFPGGGKLEVHLTVDKKDGTILGGYIIGPQESGTMIDVIGMMAQNKMKADDAAWFDAAYAPPFAPVWNAVISAAGKFNR